MRGPGNRPSRTDAAEKHSMGASIVFPTSFRSPLKSRPGKKPAVTAIHAGLECGIIGSAYPGLDMISFGPTICYPHSPDEKVEIASVGKFYDFLVDTLRNVPEK